jgi:hypothetical protein
MFMACLQICKFLLFWIMLSACGIETVSILDEPEKVGSLIFYQNAKNLVRSDYFGINIYYRIYDTESAATADVTKYESSKSAQLLPGNATIYLTAASGLKYRQVFIANILPDPNDVTEQPLTTVLDLTGVLRQTPTIRSGSTDSDQLMEIFLSNRSRDSGQIVLRVNSTATRPASEIYLLRDTIEANLFSKVPFLDDPDYAATTSDSDGGTYVQFFIASYGSSATLVDVFSDAVFLGRVELQR